MYEIKVEYPGAIRIVFSHGRVIDDNRPIELKEKKYKIILMAMEIKEDGAGTTIG